MFVFRLTSELDTEFFKELGVYLAALQLWKLFHCELCGRIGCRGDGERNQDLINVKPRILAPKILGLDFLDWLDSGRGDHMKIVIDSGKVFQCIEDQLDVFPVRIFPSGSSMAAAAAPVFSALSSAASTTVRSWIET